MEDNQTGVVHQLSWKWWEALGVAVAATVGIELSLAILINVLDLTNRFGIDYGSVGFNFLFLLLIRALGVGLILWFVTQRGKGASDIGLRATPILKGIGYALAGFVGFLIISEIVLAVLEFGLPNLSLNQQQSNAFTEAAGFIDIGLSFVVFVLVAPIAEEIIFRGFLFSSFSRRMGTTVAALITSTLFGAVHLSGGDELQISAAVVTGILGLVLCWVYVKTKSLWPAILLHSIKNAVAFLLIFEIIQINVPT